MWSFYMMPAFTSPDLLNWTFPIYFHVIWTLLAQLSVFPTLVSSVSSESTGLKCKQVLLNPEGQCKMRPLQLCYKIKGKTINLQGTIKYSNSLGTVTQGILLYVLTYLWSWEFSLPIAKSMEGNLTCTVRLAVTLKVKHLISLSKLLSSPGKFLHSPLELNGISAPCMTKQKIPEASSV